MNENDFQRLVIEKLTKLEKNINDLTSTQDVIIKDIGNLTSTQDVIIKDIGNMKITQDVIIKDIGNMKITQDVLVNEINVLKQKQDETYLVVQAIEHSNNIGKAELDQHNIRLAKSECTLKKIAKVIDDDLGTASIV